MTVVLPQNARMFTRYITCVHRLSINASHDTVVHSEYMFYLFMLGSNTMKNIAITAALLSLISANPAFAAANTQTKQLKDVAPYPAATKTTNRNVIWLQEQKDESLYKVEIIASKAGSKDCNNTWYSGKLEEKTLKGWGYNYYSINDIQGPASTRMACNNKAAANTRASLPIQLGEKNFMRYNSKLPIVIYAPKDVVIHYKIWEAPASAQPAELANQ